MAHEITTKSENTARRCKISLAVLTGAVSGTIRAAIDWIVEHLLPLHARPMAG